jgi:hypothetical protein
MTKPIRRAVIARIAVRNRVSFGTAAHIYDMKPIWLKQKLCREEERRQAKASSPSDSEDAK